MVKPIRIGLKALVTTLCLCGLSQSLLPKAQAQIQPHDVEAQPAEPSLVTPQSRHHYDGYCYERESEAKAQGAIFGMVSNGLISAPPDKTSSEPNPEPNKSPSDSLDQSKIINADLAKSGVIGFQIDRATIQCFENNYYTYGSIYYDPPEPPAGFIIVFFESRPKFERHHFIVYRPSLWNNDGPIMHHRH